MTLAIATSPLLDGALRLLPQHIRAAATSLSPRVCGTAEEIRLRTGFPAAVLGADGEHRFGGAVTTRDLDDVLENATGASVHTARDTLKNGFVTVRGGYRIGVGGTVITKNGEIQGFRAVSSLAIRIPRELRGVCEPILPDIAGHTIRSTLIISPPGAGKTTLLRDLVRVISDGDARFGITPHRVGLADERAEIAALQDGVPQLYVGSRTDVLSGCPKSEAVLMITRVLNPEVVALDEITSPDDVHAVERACLCGAKLIATAHADSRGDLTRKPVFKLLLESRVFEKLVTVSVVGGTRRYAVEDMPC
ncbi:MAG: stage III sporulation protein AB [Oscillospiraceae bacterium]|jgi:stage III sporulation protein AA|nr:stage III sporulation protein AB [Oscillospiraceae bacterium]